MKRSMRWRDGKQIDFMPASEYLQSMTTQQISKSQSCVQYSRRAAKYNWLNGHATRRATDQIVVTPAHQNIAQASTYPNHIRRLCNSGHSGYQLRYRCKATKTYHFCHSAIYDWPTLQRLYREPRCYDHGGQRAISCMYPYETVTHSDETGVPARSAPRERWRSWNSGLRDKAG